MTGTYAVLLAIYIARDPIYLMHLIYCLIHIHNLRPRLLIQLRLDVLLIRLIDFFAILSKADFDHVFEHILDVLSIRIDIPFEKHLGKFLSLLELGNISRSERTIVESCYLKSRDQLADDEFESTGNRRALVLSIKHWKAHLPDFSGSLDDVWR